MNLQQTSKQFSTETPSEIEKLRIVFTLTQQYLDNIERRRELLDKSVKRSIEAREAGNKLYTSNKGHNPQIHYDILSHYSKCIAFAPKNTKELALGYSNRSSLLMHLQMYKEALVDIDRAWQLTNDNEYKKKLLARKEKCLALLNEQNLVKATKHLTLAENKELDKIRSKVMNFKPSATVPCASESVGLGYNKTFGRHLVATRNIKPGEILIIEKGYACSPTLEQKYFVCTHCLQVAWNGLPCNQCVFTIYCSEDCKNEAFNEYHDIECPILKYMDHAIFDKERNGSDRMMTLRILIKALRKEGFDNVIKEVSKKQNNANLDVLLTNGILQNDKFKSCYNLLSHVKETGLDDEKFEFHTMQILYLLMKHTNFLVSLIGENSLADNISSSTPPVFNESYFKVDPQLILKFKKVLIKLKYIAVTNEYVCEPSIWQCNCGNVHKCRQTCNTVRGIAIFPSCSLLNHSCTPNVSHICAPKQNVIVFSTCSIKKGEMLCDSYGVSLLDSDLEARKNRLERIFSCKCKCKACLDKIDLSMVPDRPKNSSKLSLKMERNFPASATNLYFYETPETYEISEEVLQYMTKFSQLMYKYFTYYEAYVHSSKCEGYIEKVMSNLFRETNFMPNSC